MGLHLPDAPDGSGLRGLGDGEAEAGEGREGLLLCSRGDDHSGDFRDGRDDVRRDRVQLFGRSENDGFGGALAEGTLDVGLFEVAGGEADLGVNACDAHEVGVGVDAADVFDGGCTDGDDGVLEEPAANEDHVDVAMRDQFHRDGGAVGDDGRLKLRCEVARDLNRGGAAVEDDDLAGLHHGCGGAADALFLFGGEIKACGEIADCR